MKFRYFRYISLIIVTIVSSFLSFNLEAVNNGQYTVVIDAGHGGKDAGAVDNGVNEKDINLGVATKLAELLKKNVKDVNVVMTRDKDVFISLQERAQIANKAKGDLFVSIHTNSLDKNNKNRKTAEGTSVYVLGLHKDQDNMKVAQRENSVIELEQNYSQKYSGFDPTKDESYIIFEMAQKSNLSHSFKFADEAQRRLVSVAERKDRGVKQAGFWVLWATSMPAVLVELDFICNPTSAEFMASEDGQNKLATSLCKAVEAYFKNQRAVDSGTATRELQTAPEKPKKTVAPKQESTRGTAVAQRRRRPETAKAASDQNVITSQEIPLHLEGGRMSGAVADTISNSEKLIALDPNLEKDRKSRKSKQEKIKDEKSVKTQKADVQSRKSNRIVTIADGGHKSKSGVKPKSERIMTVYKIQILASEERLKTNDSRFCGLSPVFAIKDKNLYKYTYGESESKAEIDALLKKVRQKIPDAFIISSRK